MGLRQLVILCHDVEFPYLVADLGALRPSLTFKRATDRKDLDDLSSAELAESRLLGFCTGLIVPARVLHELGYGAYNIHPAPPEFPGWRPAVLASRKNLRRFGATASEMAVRVDTGAIVGVEEVDVPVGADVEVLETLAYSAAIALVGRLSLALVSCEQRLPHIPVEWGVHRSTKALVASLLSELPA